MTLPPGYLDQLNPQQRSAVEYCDGPQLVIAGAGSGKTRVLTYKIVHLLSLGMEPWRILALTFTNKAAREMRERIEALTGASTARSLWMGTFHSIFARILRANAELLGFRSNFTIYDASDSKSLVKTIIKDMHLDDSVYKPSTVLAAISSAKNALLSPEDYAASADLMKADRDARRPEIHNIYRTYRDRCFVAGAMDFDDLLYNTDRLLRENPDVLRHYREFFRYVLVDEYQDTNFAQHVIVTRLTKDSGHLCVVGDDAQSIYSFRGANIRNILDLRDAYPDLVINKLERNYRSTRNIIDAAGSLIDKNRDQIPKNVYSENESGRPIEVVRCYSDFEEAYQIASRLSQTKMASGDSYEEFAILYRTNAQSRLLEEALRKRNIPYRIYGGLSFYQRKEIKDATSYFRLALNPDDDEALRRVINFPARGIGETTLAKLTRRAIDDGCSVWQVISDPDLHPVDINAGTRRKLGAFESLIREFTAAVASDVDALDVAKLVIERTGLYSMLVHDKTPESISKMDNLEQLLAGVKEFVENRREEGSDDLSLAAFMAEVSLATDQDSDGADSDERVTLMTVHAAKGLEFNNVFVVGVEEDLFPSAMAGSHPSAVEEERRLMYVAITRARKFCLLSYARSRFRNGQTAACRPSRFLGDIDPAYIHVAEGSAAPELSATTPRRDHSSKWNPSYAGSSRSLESLRSPRTLRPLSSPQPAFTPLSRPGSSVSSGGGAFSFHSVGELAEGTRIEHSKFGHGTVAQIDQTGADARITVSFDSGDSRTLMLKFAKFAIL